MEKLREQINKHMNLENDEVAILVYHEDCGEFYNCYMSEYAFYDWMGDRTKRYFLENPEIMLDILENDCTLTWEDLVDGEIEQDFVIKWLTPENIAKLTDEEMLDILSQFTWLKE